MLFLLKRNSNDGTYAPGRCHLDVCINFIGNRGGRSSYKKEIHLLSLLLGREVNKGFDLNEAELSGFFLRSSP